MFIYEIRCPNKPKNQACEIHPSSCNTEEKNPPGYPKKILRLRKMFPFDISCVIPYPLFSSPAVAPGL